MHWSNDAIFYHIYPLGFCGALGSGALPGGTQPLAKIHGWVEHLKDLGVNAVYLGPVFASVRHGYDTTDYTRVDPRLGDNETLREVVAHLHRRGIRVILDGVFNHVGRAFGPFQDVRRHLDASPYWSWFSGITRAGRTPLGDPFTYDTWAGHYDLVKLDLAHPEVRAHLLGAVGRWIDEFGIDGLRLDAADVMSLDFLRELRAYCRGKKRDFWLVGEVVKGDYTRWANPDTLDSVTNYEAYKGLYSSHNDGNYFEIAHTLNRQFGSEGIYRDLTLYNFADNHDVTRVASVLNDTAHLYPLHILLFAMPGVPSVYYGSEWGVAGKKNGHSDLPLRPCLDLERERQTARHRDLAAVIRKLAAIRSQSPALKHGRYRQLHVSHKQFAFLRECPEETVVVMVNASDRTAACPLPIGQPATQLTDLLNCNESFSPDGRQAVIEVPANWGRILKLDAPPRGYRAAQPLLACAD